MFKWGWKLCVWVEKQLICWYWILDERLWGISKWELIEKRKKINIGKELKVDSRSKTERASGDENSCCFNWRALTGSCFALNGLVWLMEWQNIRMGGLIVMVWSESVCLHWNAEYTGRAHCRSSYHFPFEGNALLFPSLTSRTRQLPLRRVWWEKLVIFLLSSF